MSDPIFHSIIKLSNVALFALRYLRAKERDYVSSTISKPSYQHRIKASNTDFSIERAVWDKDDDKLYNSALNSIKVYDIFISAYSEPERSIIGEYYEKDLIIDSNFLRQANIRAGSLLVRNIPQYGTIQLPIPQ